MPVIPVNKVADTEKGCGGGEPLRVAGPKNAIFYFLFLQ
jgi:hypothetical protein